jgi:hypothetical protein
MNTLMKKVEGFFKRPKKYATLTIPKWVNATGPFPGILNGGVVRAEVVDETDKALKVHYSRQYLSLVFGISSRVQEYCEWMLKTDNRIVETYER